MNVVGGGRFTTLKSTTRGLPFFAVYLFVSFGIWFPHVIPVKYFILFPQNEYGLVGTLPKIKRRNCLVRVVPHEPPAIYLARNSSQYESQCFTEPIYEHRAIILE